MRLVLFDLDNTLVDRAEGLRRWAWEFCADHRLGPEDAEWLVAADRDGLEPRDTFFAAVRARFSLSESVAELIEDFRERNSALIPVVPGVRCGLPRLRAAGWRIGVVTNGDADEQLGTLVRTGLAGMVDGWAISAHEGVGKPDRRLFEIAAGRCEAPLDGGWMVGDSAAADITGGRAAGLHTVWVHRGRRWPQDDGAPDHVVGDAAGAIELLLG
ncbi:HAD family hydrolase [Amycolatopsis sp. PS_44_ISF1]|uniref:HAD family hydrolase n=1 Tax=Amycolatopsis sp. PS_44_ISF1 TaxID=2974917 RepID=UPI0028E095A0|nr:HAD family hydrolase [Amycolatopsis sp. PS_44_ISF1]MDT8915913.1 HAD family hydrolase [Amycolatopsis sp. PS_44_ISF1]